MPFYLVFLYLFPFGSSFGFVLFFHFIIRPCFISLFPFMSFNFCNASSLSPYIDFPFLHLKVNLHTYLTTWLSSCPVGIFPRSHHIIAKISIISKVSPLKWNHLKSTHIITCNQSPHKKIWEPYVQREDPEFGQVGAHFSF